MNHRLPIAALLLLLAGTAVSTQDTNAGGAYQTFLRGSGTAFFALAQGLLNGAAATPDLVVGNEGGSVFVVSDGGPVVAGATNLPEDVTLALNTQNPSLAVGWVRTPRNSGPAQILSTRGTCCGAGLLAIAGPVTTSAGTEVITFQSSRNFTDVAAGDINGDNFDDVLIVEPGLSRLLIVFGRADLTSRDFATTPPDAIVTGVVSAQVASGDVTGDGIADIVLGAYHPSGAGAAYVIRGRASFPATLDLAANADAIFPGTHHEGGAGRSIGVADFDGDGVLDIVVGANQVSTEWPGRAYIVYGSPTLTSRSLDLANVTFMAPVLRSTPTTLTPFALGLAAGDINRDGFDDVLVRSDEAVYVYYGRPRQFSVSGYDRRITCCTGSAAGTSTLRDAMVFDRGGDGRDVVLLNSGGVMFFASDRAGTLGTTTPTIVRTLAPGASTVATVQISNSGARMIFWSVVVSKDTGGNWISASPTTGVTGAGGASSVNLMLTGLAPGTYTATVIVVPENQPPQHFIRIPVMVTVQ